MNERLARSSCRQIGGYVRTAMKTPPMNEAHAGLNAEAALPLETVTTTSNTNSSRAVA